MANTYLLGFAAVAAIAVAGVDYMVQAEAAGAKPGAYPVSAYVDTFAGRFNAMRAEQTLATRQSVRAKTHLPEAPEGWERREWEPDLSDRFQKDMALPDGSQQLADALDTSFLATQMRNQANSAARKMAKERVWEYVRGDEVIRLSAHYAPPPEAASIQDVVTELALTNMSLFLERAEGYAIVQGVPFFTLQNALEETETPEEGAIVPINLKAQMGRDIRLAVNAHATAESVRMLLERIDYDALNAMLDNPESGVGSAAPALTPDQETEMAAAAAEAHRAALLHKSDDLELRAVAAANTLSGSPEVAAPAMGLNGQQANADQGNALSRIKSFFGSGESAGAGKGEPADKPQRLQLSGGASCLEGSAGRFCRD